jgi:uncharacterized SAM-dependent methyltransferase
LPGRIAAACQASGRPFFVLAIEGYADPAIVADRPHAWVRLGAAGGRGIDLLKEAGTLIAAYDDSAGVTAAFNKNILVRINRELGADIDLGTFDHRAVWNAAEERIEMHLVSRAKQSISIADTTFDYARGETIHTENSHKYRLEDFSALAADAGWRVVRAWVSASPAFAVLLLG